MTILLPDRPGAASPRYRNCAKTLLLYMWVEALFSTAVFASVQVLSSIVGTNPLGLFSELIPKGSLKTQGADFGGEGKSKRAGKMAWRKVKNGVNNHKDGLATVGKQRSWRFYISPTYRRNTTVFLENNPPCSRYSCARGSETGHNVTIAIYTCATDRLLYEMTDSV